nr:MmcQ/YjbR family DNA-binding protein [uncultured Flavobacterium sp.]
MNILDLQEFIQKLGPVTYDTPFDQDTLVFRIGGKIFLLTSLADWENATPKINIKALPENVELYKANYTFVHPGYHMNKKHWITVELSEFKNFKLISCWIQDAYTLVYKSLPKKTQTELLSKK